MTESKVRQVYIACRSVVSVHPSIRRVQLGVTTPALCLNFGEVDQHPPRPNGGRVMRTYGCGNELSCNETLDSWPVSVCFASLCVCTYTELQNSDGSLELHFNTRWGNREKDKAMLEGTVGPPRPTTQNTTLLNAIKTLFWFSLFTIL